MNLLFLYGLPAVGKLTIAKELIQQLDSYKLFHNQMTVDIISPIIPFGHPKNFELNGKYRMLMYEACIEIGINLVTTFVYALEEDDAYIKTLIDRYHKGGGSVFFVHLTCDLEVVNQRLQNEDRKQHRKLGNPDGLRQNMERWELTTAIPFVNNLVLDTTHIPPEETAKKIIEHYQLAE